MIKTYRAVVKNEVETSKRTTPTNGRHVLALQIKTKIQKLERLEAVHAVRKQNTARPANQPTSDSEESGKNCTNLSPNNTAQIVDAHDESIPSATELQRIPSRLDENKERPYIVPSIPSGHSLVARTRT